MSYLQSIINNILRSDVIEDYEQKIVYLKRREHALFCATVALLQVQTSDFAKKVVHFQTYLLIIQYMYKRFNVYEIGP